MDQFLMGAAATASFVVGVFFLRYWRDTRDRLFVIFGTAFFILGGTRVALAISISKSEDHTYIYWFRFLAFALILAAIIDKNRPRNAQAADDAGPSPPCLSAGRTRLDAVMTNLVRQEIAASAHTIVVKVGTRVLTHADGALNVERVAGLAEELHRLLEHGRKVVLVSSGAVGAGMAQLGLTRRPSDLPHLQAVAAVGQAHLVQTYDRALREHGRHAAQVLLTAEDLNDRVRYLNVRNTLRVLLEYRAVPIINENDTVSTEELQTTFGDNDRLAAMVTNLLRAPLLVLLSDVEGLYDGDPADADSKLIDTVTRLDDVYGLVRDKKSGLSKGGMASKLNTAQIATTAGENVIIASGREPGALAQILAGETVGTLCLARGQSLPSYKRWIGFTVQPRGSLTLDEGAATAVEQKGRSLLAIGIREVIGEFAKGDVVVLHDLNGAELARGLTNYTSAELQAIKGLKTDQIAATLGHCPYSEVIHRDNMALTR